MCLNLKYAAEPDRERFYARQHNNYAIARIGYIHCVPKKGSHQTLGSNFVIS